MCSSVARLRRRELKGKRNKGVRSGEPLDIEGSRKETVLRRVGGRSCCTHDGCSYGEISRSGKRGKTSVGWHEHWKRATRKHECIYRGMASEVGPVQYSHTYRLEDGYRSHGTYISIFVYEIIGYFVMSVVLLKSRSHA